MNDPHHLLVQWPKTSAPAGTYDRVVVQLDLPALREAIQQLDALPGKHEPRLIMLRDKTTEMEVYIELFNPAQHRQEDSLYQSALRDVTMVTGGLDYVKLPSTQCQKNHQS